MSGQLSSSRNVPLRIGVRMFWCNLNVHFREAQQGGTILCTSHDKMGAKLHPLSPSYRSYLQPSVLRGRSNLRDTFDQAPQDTLEFTSRYGGDQIMISLVLQHAKSLRIQRATLRSVSSRFARSRMLF